MAGNYQEVSASDIKSLIYDDSHITMYVTFKSGNTPVDVSDPTFELKDSNDIVKSVTILKPLQKDPDVQAEAGKYLITFLSRGMNAGDYTATFSGTYQSAPITATTTLSLFEQPREQYLIDLLRGSLSGKYNTEVPRNYFTFDPTKKQWKDGELYQCLYRALDAINNVPPLTYFTLDSVPLVNLLILGGELYAVTDLAILEDTNYFDITIPVKVTLYKGDKLKDMARFLREQWQDPVKAWKDYYNMENTNAQGIAMKRVPIRLLRPVSDNLFFHSLAWARRKPFWRRKFNLFDSPFDTKSVMDEFLRWKR